MPKTTISIIIPTYNEEKEIAKLIKYLQKTKPYEILVVDGGSSDKTRELVKKTKAKLLISPKKGRAAQMNYGAKRARGNVFYFLHADTYPPKTFIKDISESIKKGCQSGSFSVKFDWENPLLSFTVWFIRYFKGIRYGDQSLFVTREAFDKVGGFNEKLVIFEDADIVKRLRRNSSYITLREAVTTSARKFKENGVTKLLAIYSILHVLYSLNFSQKTLLRVYKNLIRQSKI